MSQTLSLHQNIISSVTGGSVGTTANSVNINTLNRQAINGSSVVELSGPNADVRINGVSLNQTLQGIQQRLCLLLPNPALEAEWAQLRDLGVQYRQLEAELLEKHRAWAILKKKQG